MEEQPANVRLYRPLAPRQTHSGEVAAPTTPPVEEGKTTKRASTACKECKRRRTRCSTGNPCSECATHNRACVYDETADKRRKMFTKHTQNQMQFFRGFLERLLESIRYADDQRLAELIGIIRADGTNQDILSVVQSILGDSNRNHQMDGDQVDGDLEDAEGSEALSGVAEGLLRTLAWATAGLA